MYDGAQGHGAVVAAAEAAVRTQQDVTNKLRQIRIGLQQDLALATLGAGRCIPKDGRATLGAALEACQERIAREEAVLGKLQQLRQGLIADLGCGGTGGEGDEDGGDSGTV